MFEDKTLKCKECGAEFVFTAGEQEFYAEKGFCIAGGPARPPVTPSPSAGCGPSSGGPWVCAAVWAWACSSA